MKPYSPPPVRPDAGLEGRVCLVTGAGRGLGREVCRTLGDAGATLVAADIEEDWARDTATSIDGRGTPSMAVAVDVRDILDSQRAVSQTIARYGRLDILVNNAGTDVTCAFDQLSVEDWDRVLGTNLRGPFLMAHAAFPVMKEQGGGHIVNVISTAAKRAWADAAAYHASKWGLLGLSHALHVEGRSCRIKVTAVISGGMRTPFLMDRFPDIDTNRLQDPANVASTIRFVLTQPPGTVIPEIMVLPIHETSWP